MATTYEAWRISFQSSEQAAKAAWDLWQAEIAKSQLGYKFIELHGHKELDDLIVTAGKLKSKDINNQINLRKKDMAIKYTIESLVLFTQICLEFEPAFEETISVLKLALEAMPDNDGVVAKHAIGNFMKLSADTKLKT